MTNNDIPLRFSRLIALFFAWEWAVVALSIVINSFVKARQDKDNILDALPASITVSINTNDVFQARIMVTIVSALLFVSCTIFIVFLIIDSSLRSGISIRALTWEYSTLAFFAVWLFAVQVAVTAFVASRSTQVTAFIDGIEVPDRLLKEAERAAGVVTAYRDIDYFRLVAILPWFTFLFTVVAAAVSFTAAMKARKSSGVATRVSKKVESPEMPERVQA
ncbi:hypothetical protein DFH09DRAFT_501049 [Mycena vulgaris]|nr:hypothetical protein DFH09DRAFT_501049 [Mycena vulgaris]